MLPRLGTMRLLLPLLLFFHLSQLAFSLNQEGIYLLEAKRGLGDPDNVLANWNPRDDTPCNWTGVSCSPPRPPSSDRIVTSIDLSGEGLLGPFPAVLCRLPFLDSLSLSENFINSSLHDSALRPCSSLSNLDLSTNNIVGPLPASLADLPSLLYLDLSANNFSGPIPPSFTAFPRLQRLSLLGNLLTSTIPSFLSNVTTLHELQEGTREEEDGGGGKRENTGTSREEGVRWGRLCAGEGVARRGSLRPALGRVGLVYREARREEGGCREEGRPWGRERLPGGARTLGKWGLPGGARTLGERELAGRKAAFGRGDLPRERRRSPLGEAGGRWGRRRALGPPGDHRRWGRRGGVAGGYGRRRTRDEDGTREEEDGKKNFKLSQLQQM